MYPVREDTLLLQPFAAERGRGRLLEMGCGNGALSLAAARAGWRVVATDRNPTALARLALTARRENLNVAVVRADLAEGLGRFDRVLANPPYLPTRAVERDPDRWENLALDGGPDGLVVTRRILASLREHLREGGEGFVLVSSLSPASRRKSLWDDWRRRGGKAREVATRELSGERLSVWRLTPFARRGGAPRRGTDARPTVLPRPRSASNPGPGRGRSSARDGASDRRRSPRGS